jgi:hypothetical protein
MCGIFGMVLGEGSLSRDKRTVGAALLAAYNEERGNHSWGLAAWRRGEPHVVKGMHSPVRGALDMARETAWLGHSRYATVGDKTVDNAHPFRFGHIIGAHNGAVYNHADVAKAYGRTFAVDSMHIFAHLAEGLPSDELEGYGAVEFLDVNTPGSVFLAKLRLGDLCVLGIKGGEQARGVLWSSDKDHVWEVADALGLDCFLYKLDDGQVYEARRTGLYETTRPPIALATPEWSNRGCGYTGPYTGSDSWRHDRDEAWKAAAHERGKKWLAEKSADGTDNGEWLAGKYRDGAAGEAKEAKAQTEAERAAEAEREQIAEAEVVKLLAEELDEDDADFQAWLDDMMYAKGEYLDPSDPKTKRAFVLAASQIG